MIDIIQGSSVTLAITIKDSQDQIIDLQGASAPDNVIIELYPEASHQVIARYAVTDPNDGKTYGNAAFVDDLVMVYVDGPDTTAMPIGKIIGKVITTFANNDFASGYETIIQRGALLNVQP